MSCETRPGSSLGRRGRADGHGSTTTNPPTVVTGEYDRSTPRSPQRQTSGASKRRRTTPEPPAGIVADEGVTRAITSAVPTCTLMRERWVSGRACARSVTAASTVRLARQASSLTTVLPRRTAARSTPTSASAVRRPGSARAVCTPCTSTPRTREDTSTGSTRTVAPVCIVPAQVVPVTTVPAPATLNDRSTGMRNRSSVGRSTARCAARPSASRSASSPTPVFTDTACGGSH